MQSRSHALERNFHQSVQLTRFKCLQVICVPGKEQCRKKTQLTGGLNREFDYVENTASKARFLFTGLSNTYEISVSATAHTSNIRSPAILIRHNDS